MLIRYGYEITLTCPQATALVCLLSVHQDRAADLRAAETLFTTPEVPTSTYHDLFGNRCLRLVAPAGDMTLWGDATIEDDGQPDKVLPDARETPLPELPDDCLVYLLGSRYCETDRLSQTAWDLFGGIAPGWGRVQAICDYVHQHIRFDYMQARSTRSAFEAFHERIGVCRDFAHLAVAFCRCLNIPARYVNGHLGDIGVPVVDPMDFSAWIEVFLDGAWHTFDPRNNVPRIGRIVVARGRDAADIPLINSFGPHVLKGFRVWTYEVETAEQKVKPTNNIIEIDGEKAVITFDSDIQMLRGEFVGLNGGADFHAESVHDLIDEGRKSLAVHLDMCREKGIEPRRKV